MTENLKPCPFCGKQPAVKAAGRRDFFYILCQCCGFRTCLKQRQEVIKRWNQRSVEESPKVKKPGSEAFMDALCRKEVVNREHPLIMPKKYTEPPPPVYMAGRTFWDYLAEDFPVSWPRWGIYWVAILVGAVTGTFLGRFILEL